MSSEKQIIGIFMKLSKLFVNLKTAKTALRINSLIFLTIATLMMSAIFLRNLGCKASGILVFSVISLAIFLIIEKQISGLSKFKKSAWFSALIIGSLNLIIAAWIAIELIADLQQSNFTKQMANYYLTVIFILIPLLLGFFQIAGLIRKDTRSLFFRNSI
jgi:hypothetical protein